MQRDKKRISARFARHRAKRARLVTEEYLEILYAVQARRCAYCRCHLTRGKRRLDHIRPRRLLGEHARGNLCWICAECDGRKNCDVLESIHPKYQKAARQFVERAVEHASMSAVGSETAAKSGQNSLRQAQKRCTTCGLLKGLSEFHREKKQKDQLRSQCKACNLARSRNSEQKRASDARREAQRRIERQFGNLSKHWVRQASLVTGAYLSTLYEVQDRKCAYCRRALNRRNRHLDHIRPLYRRGRHTRENVCWTCTKCNYDKLDDVDPRYQKAAQRFTIRAIRISTPQDKT